jgi:hypothetical protein
MGQQVGFARRVRRIEKDGCSLLLQAEPDAPHIFELLPSLFGAREAVEQPSLLFARKQALVIVRPVQVDEKVSQGAKQRQGAWRPVDKLPARAGRGQRPLEGSWCAASPRRDRPAK